MGLFLNLVYAQEKKAESKKERLVESSTTTKEVLGEITWLDKRFIAIRYESNPQTHEEFEILLPFAPEKITLEHIRALNQLKKGDIVRVQYQEDMARYDSKRLDINRKARGISFVRRPPATNTTEQDSGTNTLSSE